MRRLLPLLVVAVSAYQASVRSRAPLQIGRRYTIRVTAPDGRSASRRVLLTQRP